MGLYVFVGLTCRGDADPLSLLDQLNSQQIEQSSMLAHRHDQPIQKSLRRYLKKSGRVSFELKDLVELLKVPQNYVYLAKVLASKQTVTHMFKILILVNRMLLQRIKQEQVMAELINNLKWQARGELDLILEKKLLLPYKLFLQKRAVSQINVFYAKNTVQSQVRVYQLINLLTMGTSFTDIIYTFGRYYIQEYGCAVDFNISIGADLQVIYKNMVDNVRRPASREILEEIEMLHEKLYVVFYNCYFHKYLKHYVPKWVITDIPNTPRKDTANKSTRSNSNTKVRSYSSISKSHSTASSKKQPHNESMADSCLFLNNHEVQQVVENIELQQDFLEQPAAKDRLKLLQSMERVVSMCKQ